MIEPKPLFKERIAALLENNSSDINSFWEIIKKPLPKTLRCNTLKISPEHLKKRLEKQKIKVSQPYQEHPEIMSVESELLPGQLGKTKEHLLGYYYVQELSSMMPMLSLNPNKDDILLDIAASPGSKTTQASAMMENQGIIIANDFDLGRITILSSNLQKIGSSNVLITRHDGVVLAKKLDNLSFKFTKMSTDVPCSGEGNIRSNPKTFVMWNLKAIEKLSRIQKKLASSALELLHSGGEIVYSTCTHAPEENEEVIQHLLDNFDLEILKTNLPMKTRPGLTEWQGKTFSQELKKAHRIYPQDNDSEGFFLCKMRKKS